MNTASKLSALGMAGALMAIGAPAQAAPAFDYQPHAQTAQTGMEAAWEHGRHRDWRNGHRHETSRRYYDEPVYANTRTWRGRDGRYYCQRKDGTTGLIVGGAVGAILGREIDSRGDRSLGTILGAAGGALLGKKVAQGSSRCR